MRDHRGNEKVERKIRTINERLRTNKKIVVEREKSELSNSLLALNFEKRADGKSAFEKHMGRKPNTLKSAMIGKCILERGPLIEIEPEDFSDKADSTSLVRERVRGTKLEGAFRKMRGNIVREAGKTVTILPRSGKSTIVSMREIANTTPQQGTAQQDNTKPKSAEKKKPQEMGEKVTITKKLPINKRASKCPVKEEI